MNMRNKVNQYTRIVCRFLVISSLSIIAVLNLNCSGMFCTYKTVKDLRQLPVRLYLPFEISLEKEVYEVGEPILLFMQLKNYDDVNINIPPFVFSSDLQISLFRHDVRITKNIYENSDWVDTPLKPSERIIEILHLYNAFGENLKYLGKNGLEKYVHYRFLTPGEYELSAFVPYYFSTTWCRGRTDEVKIKFTVVESERGRAFLDLLKEIDQPIDNDLRRKKLLESVEGYKGTLFATYLRYTYLLTADPYRNADDDNYIRFMFENVNSLWAPLVFHNSITGANLGYNKLELEKHGIVSNGMKDYYKQLASASRGSYLEKYINYLLSQKYFRWE